MCCSQFPILHDGWIVRMRFVIVSIHLELLEVVLGKYFPIFTWYTQLQSQQNNQDA